MEIEEKYIKMIGKDIYHKALNRFGQIASIEIMFMSGYKVAFNAYCGEFNSRVILFLQDFIDGTVAFNIVNDNFTEESAKKEIEEIKTIFGDKFREDMLCYTSVMERAARLQKEKEDCLHCVAGQLVKLDAPTVEMFSDDYYLREFYVLYKDGKLTENEMLYAMVNYLAKEYKKVNESNLGYFGKYILKDMMKDCCCATRIELKED